MCAAGSSAASARGFRRRCSQTRLLAGTSGAGLLWHLAAHSKHTLSLFSGVLHSPGPQASSFVAVPFSRLGAKARPNRRLARVLCKQLGGALLSVRTLAAATSSQAPLLPHNSRHGSPHCVPAAASKRGRALPAVHCCGNAAALRARARLPALGGMLPQKRCSAAQWRRCELWWKARRLAPRARRAAAAAAAPRLGRGSAARRAVVAGAVTQAERARVARAASAAEVEAAQAASIATTAKTAWRRWPEGRLRRRWRPSAAAEAVAVFLEPPVFRPAPSPQ